MDPVIVGWWVLGAAGVATLVNQGLGIARTFTRGDRDSRQKASAATTQDEIRQLREEIESMRESHREDVRQLHRRIDDLPNQIIAILSNTGAINRE